MLRYLRIKNFQSHEDSDFAFDKGVNTIYGVSSSGKTAVLRALTLLRSNRPGGFRFHSRFANKKAPTEVTLTTDRAEVTFSKLGTKTSYEIFNDTGPEAGTNLYESVGRKVPEQVTEELRFSPILIQEQLDPHFLITDSSSKFAKELNRVTNFDEIDRWKSRITKKISAEKSRSVLLKENLKAETDKAERYKRAEELAAIAEELRELNVVFGKTEDLVFRLSRAALDLDETTEKLIKLKYKEKRLGKIIKEIDDISVIYTGYANLEDTLRLWESWTELKDKRVRQRDGLYRITENIEELLGKVNTGKGKLNKIDEHVVVSDRLDNKLSEADAVRDELVGALKALGLCPFCEGPITDECIARYVN